ncbi:MAG: GNAT family N-acetyltransferase [Ruminococcaceae bacterium]|nr:GNAT family N-acetyltransferase [Oscillospiraceae bacterium]
MTVIRKTETKDLESIMPIFSEARKTIALLGIDQWQNGYPSRSVIEEDVKREQSYCVLSDGKIIATFALILHGEPTYDEIFDGKWLTGDEKGQYLAIHRVAIAVASRGNGISGKIISYASELATSLGKRSLRIDTHEGNVVMRRMLEKNGFVHCGTIFLKDGDKRVAYEKLL